MIVKYFVETDTLYLQFNDQTVDETVDFDSDILIDRDQDGHVVAMTVEHASQYTNLSEFSFQKVTAEK